LYAAEKVGEDWIVPIGRNAPKPFAPAANRLWNVAPEFPAQASIVFSEGKTIPCGGGEAVPSVTLTFPAATGVAGARTYDWELVCRHGTHKAFVRHVTDYNCRRALSRALGPVKIILPKAYFPAGASVLAVSPRGYNGKVGKPLEVKVCI